MPDTDMVMPSLGGSGHSAHSVTVYEETTTVLSTTLGEPTLVEPKQATFALETFAQDVLQLAYTLMTHEAHLQLLELCLQLLYLLGKLRLLPLSRSLCFPQLHAQ